VGSAEKTVFSLDAGRSRQVTLSLSFQGGKCPLEYTVMVDADDDIDESDEQNNKQSSQACCQ
jgi:subtilase family serine protease